MMMLVLQCRQTLVQRLGLESEFFESLLVRSEMLLKQSRYQRGLRLLKGLDEDEYNSVLDFLLGVFAPAWKPSILAYYAGEGPKLGDLETWDVIEALDQGLAVGIVELTEVYEALEREGWVSGQEPCEYACKVSCDAVRMFLPHHFPPPGRQEAA